MISNHPQIPCYIFYLVLSLLATLPHPEAGIYLMHHMTSFSYSIIIFIHYMSLLIQTALLPLSTVLSKLQTEQIFNE